MEHGSHAILRFRCPDRPGILAKITPVLAGGGWDIRVAAVYGDADTSTFFIRMEIASEKARFGDLEPLLESVVEEMSLDWEVHDAREPMRVLVAVSKFEHCLVDLLHKTAIGALPIKIVGVVSNHNAARSRVEWHGMPFFHLPILNGDKERQELQLGQVIADTGAELLVLARYMQVLSDRFSNEMIGRCINIHHSFLPSFKGAKPYHQAHRRGVKLIGATAHYVTPDLDEGPIIEQDVRRATHATTANEMIESGREVEASVLSRAVKWHAERRVFLNYDRTVVL